MAEGTTVSSSSVDLGTRLRESWQILSRWFRAFWVARVSTASALLGLGLMELVPQARDVFADTSLGVGSWTAFFFILFFFWAIPVHYAARRALAWDHWAIARDRTWGLTRGERRHLQRLYRYPAIWVPRILGIVCYVAVLRGLHLASENLAAAQALPQANTALDRIDWLTFWTWINLGLFVLFVFKRRALLQRIGVKGHSGAAEFSHRPKTGKAVGQPYALIDGDLLWFRDILSKKGRNTRYKNSKPDLYFDMFILFIIAFLSALFIFAFFSPLVLAEYMPRALFLVLMLGAWVLGLAYVTAWSHRLKAPLVVLGVIAATAITAMSTRVHDVRHLPPAERAAGRQLRLDQAISAWKAVNGIPEDTDCEKEEARCRRPIIVAGQGGASRAAFFTASVIGELLDRSPAQPGQLPAFAQQLFAISSVSGSSLGAIVVRAAMEDALSANQTRRLEQGPCEVSDEHWFAHSEPAQTGKGSRPESWRDCMQAILAGDFLSPVFVGLAFRDHLSYTRARATEPVWPNRATLLEQAWENRYAKMVGTGARDLDGGSFQTSQRLARRFGYFQETIGSLEAPGSWLPLLFINGSSVASGRRILTSDVMPWYCGPKDEDPAEIVPYLLSSEAYDFFELRAGISGASGAIDRAKVCGNDEPSFSRAPDIALSTAATLSARFPIISPHGAIRNMSGDVVDYVVDGGYFENDGLATARDIAVALKRAKLKPVIIRVTNEPVRALAPGTGLKRPQPPLERDGGFLPTLIAPLAGLYNTRAGHGAEAARAVVELSPNDNYSYIEIGVYDQLPDTAIDRRTCAAYNTQYNYPAVVRELSMSWWLSQPVQEFLDAQLCHPKNRDGLKLIKALLSETPSRAPATGQIHSTKGGQELVRSVEAGPLGSESKAAPELTPRHRP